MSFHHEVDYVNRLTPLLQQKAPNWEAILEIGPQAGLLAIEALHQGTSRAYILCEDYVPAWLEQMIAENQMTERAFCLCGNALQVPPPELVQAILYQPFALEDLARRSLQLAQTRSRWLHAEGLVSQESLEIRIQPLPGRNLWDDLVKPHSPLKTRLQSRTRYFLNEIQPMARDACPLAETPSLLFLREAWDVSEFSAQGKLSLTSAHDVQGLLVNLNGAARWLPLSQLLHCSIGDILEIELRCHLAGDNTIWAWSVRLKDVLLKQSNLFSNPQSLTQWRIG